MTGLASGTARGPRGDLLANATFGGSAATATARLEISKKQRRVIVGIAHSSLASSPISWTMILVLLFVEQNRPGREYRREPHIIFQTVATEERNHASGRSTTSLRQAGPG